MARGNLKVALQIFEFLWSISYFVWFRWWEGEKEMQQPHSSYNYMMIKCYRVFDCNTTWFSATKKAFSSSSHELYLKIYDWWCNRDNMIKSRNQWRFWNAIISSGCTKPQNWVWLLRGSLLHSLWLRIKLSALSWKEHNRSLSLTGWKDCWCVMHQKLHLFIYQLCHMLILFSFLWWIVSSAQLERRQKDIVQDFRKTSKTTKPGLGGDKPTTKGSTRPFCQLPPGGHFGGVGENMIWSRTLWVPSTLAF